MNNLIDKKKKAEILQRIKDRKPPFCAEKPEPEKPMSEEKIPQMSEDKDVLNACLVSMVIGPGAKDDDVAPAVAEIILNGADPNIRNKNGDCLLATTVMNNMPKTVLALINGGADMNAKSADGGWTALLTACNFGHIEIVKLLIGQGVDVNTKTDAGFTGIMCAAAHSRHDIIELLKKHGAKE